MWGDVAIAFLLAFIVAFMATPYTIKIAHKIGAVDVPVSYTHLTLPTIA